LLSRGSLQGALQSLCVPVTGHDTILLHGSAEEERIAVVPDPLQWRLHGFEHACPLWRFLHNGARAITCIGRLPRLGVKRLKTGPVLRLNPGSMEESQRMQSNHLVQC
jgi:hypothetical protein